MSRFITDHSSIRVGGGPYDDTVPPATPSSPLLGNIELPLPSVNGGYHSLPPVDGSPAACTALSPGHADSYRIDFSPLSDKNRRQTLASRIHLIQNKQKGRQAATVPALANLTLICSGLPWKVTVQSPEGNGFVTVYDVLSAIQSALLTPVTGTELTILGGEFKRLKETGLRRVDCLKEKTVFTGIKSVSDGRWEICFQRKKP